MSRGAWNAIIFTCLGAILSGGALVGWFLWFGGPLSAAVFGVVLVVIAGVVGTYADFRGETDL